MEEADHLGDRVGILVGGKLACQGPPVVLKNQYGEGYNLVAVKSNTNYDDKLHQFITSKIEGAVALGQMGIEETFQLPYRSIDQFSECFRELDSRKNELNTQSYGVSITTLEEIFLKMNPQVHSDEKVKMEHIDFMMKEELLEDQG